MLQHVLPEKVREKIVKSLFVEHVSCDFDSFADQLYMSIDDVKKLVSQPSLEESNATYWENEYYEYWKNGGDLPFLEFKRMMINEADIDMTKKIDKIMKDKMRGEGLAALLGVRA